MRLLNAKSSWCALSIMLSLVSCGQVVFPPQNGPCPQNVGKPPYSCIDPGCSVATFRPGICQIYVSNGLYLCGCCTTDELKCVECGGDVGGGICLGLSSVAYQGCACSSPNNNDTGGGVPPPILLPVPPPLGFILPPPGTPMREDGGDNCPKPDLAKCSECRAIEAWCQEGENAGCPCQEDCATGDDQLKCKPENCLGSKSSSTPTIGQLIASAIGIAKSDDSDESVCTVGPQKGCACQEEPQCLDYDYYLLCSECGGTDQESDCIGLTDQNDLWKGCECIDDSNPTPGYMPFATLTQFLAAEVALGLIKPAQNTSNIGCTENPGIVPLELGLKNGTVTPDELLYQLRAVVCANKCQIPDDIPDDTWAIAHDAAGTNCEISIAIEGGIEAWIYRSSPATALEASDCSEATQSIIDNCIQNKPNKGWWNGPDLGEFYETGFRPLNDPSALHTPLSGGDNVVKSPGAGCGGGTVTNAQLETFYQAGPRKRDLLTLMEDLREILCLNLCQAPKDILTADTTVTTLGDDCELTLGLPDGLEVFAYRHTPLPSSVLQEYCWVDFQTIYDQCISKNAAQGWVNGADFAFFKMGVRPNNDPEALHAKDYYGADNHLEVWSLF